MPDQQPARKKAARFTFFSLLDAVRERLTPQTPPECQPASGGNDAHSQPSEPEGRGGEQADDNGIYDSLAEAGTPAPEAKGDPVERDDSPAPAPPTPESPDPPEVEAGTPRVSYRGPGR